MQQRIVQSASPETEILGPAIPPIARVQGHHRQQVIVKAPSPRSIAHVVRALRDGPRPQRGVEEAWDVDPVGVL